MKPSEFIVKFKSGYLWYNLIAMAAVVVLIVVASIIGLNIYTHHGEAIEVPDVKNKAMPEARHLLEEAGLVIEVSDTGYVKTLPADCVLEQTPSAGARVKSGHIVRIVINASNTPSLTLPDIADNCSLREAMAKLKAMGFKVGMPQYVHGEKDWVYGVTVDGRKVAAGDRILVDKTLTLQVGNGMMSDIDSVQVIDYHYGNHDDDFDDFEEIDDFEEVL